MSRPLIILVALALIVGCHSEKRGDETAGAPFIITLNDLADHQVVQRAIGKQHASIYVGGAVTPAAMNRVQAQVVDFAGQRVVLPWQDIVLDRNTGQFSGSIIVPQGCWYRLVVRAMNARGEELARVSGGNAWGVGINILCIGQSNMVGNGDIHTYHELASDMAGLYGNDGRWVRFKEPYDGGGAPGDVDYDAWVGVSMIPRLLDSLGQTFPGIPVGIVPAARGATPLHGTQQTSWIYRDPSDHFSRDNLYGNSIAKARAAGGVELIIMHQGETDATNSVTAEQYSADLRSLLAHYREDLPSTSPLFICQLARSFTTDRNRTDATMQEVRKAQLLSDDPPNIFLAAVCIDLPVRPGDDHYFHAAYDAIGQRIGNCIAFHYGKSAYYRGPAIQSARLSADRRFVDVQIAHRGGNDVTPAAGITGFEIAGAAGRQAIESTVRTAPSSLRITLREPAPAGAVSLTYLNGKRPDVVGAVHDDSPLRLPLEPTAGPVQVQER